MCYHHLYSFLLDYRFLNSQFDHSLFIHRTSTSIVIPLIYMDDLVVIDFDASIIIDCVSILYCVIACLDLGTLNLFFGMEVVC